MAKTITEREPELKSVAVDAKGVYYRDLNSRVRELISEGYTEIVLDGVNGQRYIGDGLTDKVDIVINGVPGNDLGAFMDGPTITVNENAQDGVGNTMNSGKIVIRGHAGDVIGYAMRGGKIFVSGDVGYRIGIHMKSYKEQVPIIVAGGKAGDFFGEYMAGGVVVLLGLGEDDRPMVGRYAGTGMHGGTIYTRGEPDQHLLGKEVSVFSLEDDDKKLLEGILAEFFEDALVDGSGIDVSGFAKLRPSSLRPYGSKYVY